MSGWMEVSYPVPYSELACSKVAKLTIKVNRERCGQILRYCPLCTVAEVDAETLRQHLRSHLRITVAHVFFSPARIGDQLVYHKRFPSLLGTTCTDHKLFDRLDVLGRESLLTAKGIDFRVLAVEVREMAIRLFFCTVCGHQTSPDVSLQEAHFLRTHLELTEVSTRTFSHFMPL